MSNFKLNSAIGLVSDESEEFDVIDNEELQVDFTPLFECLHIYEALGQSDKFRSEYSATRRQQKDLLLPTSVSLLEDDEASLSSLLEGIAGFAIIEKATMRRAPQLRSAVDVRIGFRSFAHPLAEHFSPLSICGWRIANLTKPSSRVGGGVVGFYVPGCSSPHLEGT